MGVALGGGGRSFQPMVSYTDSHPPVYLAAGDLTGDGRADLAVASGNYDNSISVRLNDGSGGFGAETVYDTFGPPNDVEIADMDGDGKRDVIVASGGRVSIFPGDGQGGLGMRRDYDAGTLAAQLRIADMNGDGEPDVVTDGVAVLFNEGAGTLGAPTVLGTGSSVDVADVNGDGALDIVGGVGSEFVAQLGDGHGAFTAVQTQGPQGCWNSPTSTATASRTSACATRSAWAAWWSTSAPGSGDPPLVRQHHRLLDDPGLRVAGQVGGGHPPLVPAGRDADRLPLDHVGEVDLARRRA